MKKKYSILILVFVILTSACFSQISKKSWNLGFGFSYPRFVSTNLSPFEGGVGGFLSLQRNFSEHVGFRLLGNYNQLAGEYNNITQTTKLISGDFDLIYYLVPCEPVSPYFLVGIGGIYFQFKKQFIPTLNDKSFIDYQFNLGFGAEWYLGDEWKFKTEFDYHTAANSKLDGIYGINDGEGILGSSTDTYMRFDIGFIYYFSKGEPSKLCDIYTGIKASSAEIDYNRIDEIVKKNETKSTESVDYNKIEKLVSKYQFKSSASKEDWVLVGVNFDFNSSTLKPESFTILSDAVRILMENPELRIEIQGYTDNVGSEEVNQELSLMRAETVRDYLVSKGIGSERLTTVGYGSKNPAADNTTEVGRSLNRRIEFKVMNY